MMISIVIAAYNSEKTIRKCLESVKSQLFSDWECIIVDGFSRDATMSIVNEFVQNDKRFRYISEPDHGIYEAFNKGWKMAKGEWIYYLGSDDQLLNNGLCELLNEAGNPEDFDVIYGNIQYLKADGTIQIFRHHSHKQLPWKNFASHQAIIMRRSIIEKLGGFDEKLKIVGDKDLIIRSYFLSPTCRYKATEALVAIFQGGGATSNNIKCFKESMYIYRKIRPGFKYLLYILQHYPRMWFYAKINKI